MKRLIEDFEKGFDFVDFPEDLISKTTAYSKIVSLRRKNFDPVLSFVNKIEREQVMLELEFFYSKESNNLEVI